MRPRWASRAVVNSIVALFSVYTLFPLLWLVTAAMKDPTNIFGSGLFDIRPAAIVGNVADVLASEGGVYPRWYLNSLLYAGLGSLVSSVIAVAAGYAFDKYHFRAKEHLFGVVLLGVMVPIAALALPMYLVASQVGLVNTFWSVLIPCLLNPFGVYLARLFSASYVPNEVVEASRIDGASDLRGFRQVALPMMAPGFVTIFLFQFVSIWNNFFLPLIMLSDRTLYPLSVGLYAWNAQANRFPEFYHLVITGSVLAVLPLVLAFVLLQRYWRSGLAIGSVK
jgi:multiple sugar transport system permease protein